MASIMESAAESPKKNIYPGDVVNKVNAEAEKEAQSGATNEITEPSDYEPVGEDAGDDSSTVENQGDDSESGQKKPEEKPEFDEGLLTQARDWDVGEDELRKMGAEEAGKMLARMDKAHLQRIRKDAASTATMDDKPSESDKVDPPAAYEPPEIDEDGHDPEIVEYIKYQNNFIKRQNERLAELEVSRQSDAPAAVMLPHQREALRSFDKLIADVGNPEFFGDGNTLELDPSGDAHQHRQAIAEAMDQFETMSRSRDPGKKPPIETLFKRAIQSEFGDEIEKHAKKAADLAKKRDDWEGAKSPKPANRERRPATYDRNDPEAVRNAQLQAIRDVKKRHGID